MEIKPLPKIPILSSDTDRSIRTAFSDSYYRTNQIIDVVKAIQSNSPAGYAEAAAQSATEAAISATAASNSATAAASSASASASSVTAAETAKTAAETARNAATTKASEATTAASNASTYATNANNSASAAATSETNAANSASAAAASAAEASASVNALPPGTPFLFAGDTCPVGALIRNGQNVSRTTYSKLFTAIGTKYGVGDGSTTFTLPDDRGEFERCADMGRGIDSGRVIGSTQTDAFKSHNHNISRPTWFANEYVAGNNIYSQQSTASAIVSNSTSIANTGGTETRPRNRAYLPCIKY